jgi:hypothetical protein
MTVRDLIAALQAMPPDAPVILNLGKNEIANEREVGRVEAVSAFQRLDAAGEPSGEWTEGEWVHDPEFHTLPVTVVNLTPA